MLSSKLNGTTNMSMVNPQSQKVIHHSIVGTFGGGKYHHGVLSTRHFLEAGPRDPFKVVQKQEWEDDWVIVKGQGVMCTNEKKLK